MYRKWVVIVSVIALVFGTGVVVGQVTNNTLNTQTVDIGSAQVQESNLDVESYELDLSGNNVTAVNTTINNTAGSDINNTNVTVTLIDSNGNVVAENTNTSVDFSSDERKTVIVDGYDTGLSNVQDIDIRVEE